MKHFFILLCAIPSLLIAQNPEIKSELPNIIPPSPSVAALMKFEEVPVNNYNGLPDISVPIYSIPLNKSLNFNLALSYHAATTKVDDVASDVGLGWAINGVGSISRTVRGLPDEFKSNKNFGIFHTDTYTGYNYYTALSHIQSYNVLDDALRGFLFEANVLGKFDTQHDLWQYNFFGRSGRFYIEKQPNGQLEVKLLDNSNLKITYNYIQPSSSVSNTLHYKPISFIIQDENGNKFEFNIIETVSTSNFTENTSFNFHTSNSVSSSDNISAIHLSKIYDLNNNEIANVSYQNGNVEQMSNGNHTTYETPFFQVGAFLNQLMPVMADGRVYSFFKPFQETTIQSRTYVTKKIKSIQIVNKCKIEFQYQTGREDEHYFNAENSLITKGIIIKNTDSTVVKKIQLNHSYYNATQKKLFLSSVVQIVGNTSQLLYGFNYKLPNLTLEHSKDKWGYFKYSSAYSSDRETDKDNVMMFVLNKMKLSTGGTVIFDYESNTFSAIGNEILDDFSSNIYNWTNSNTQTSISSINTTNSLLNVSNPVNKLTLYFDPVIGLDEWYYRIFKDGVAYDEIHSSYCIDNNCKKTYNNLPIGNYTIKLTTPQLGVNPFTNGYTHTINSILQYPITNSSNFLYGGGFRIKKIATYDTDVDPDDITLQPLSEKYFKYEGQNNSYGVLNSPLPVFDYYTSKKSPEMRQSSQQAPTMGVNVFPSLEIGYKAYSDHDIVNRTLTKGSEVGYQKVILYELNNGYTEYNYTTSLDYPDDDRTNIGCLDIPVICKDDKRGILISQNIYDKSNRILSAIQNEYEFEDYQPRTGLVVFGTYGNCFQTHPIYSFFHNYLEFKNAAVNQYCQTIYGGYNFCGYDNPSSVFSGEDFSLAIGRNDIIDFYSWVKLVSKETKNYFYDASNNQSEVVTREFYTYNAFNKMIAEHSIINSQGEETKSTYTYLTLPDVLAQNRIGEIEQIQTEKDGTLLSNSKIVYSNTLPGSTSYQPAIIQTAKGTNPLENKIRYNRYDTYGNPLEVQQENGMLIAYIWGYNNSQVVAKIENISYSAIPPSLITAIQTATNTNSSEAVVLGTLDALRNHSALATSMVTTVTHIPLVGVSTMTTPNGIRMQYHYDSMNRLEKVTDHNGNIVTENSYNYRP